MCTHTCVDRQKCEEAFFAHAAAGMKAVLVFPSISLSHGGIDGRGGKFSQQQKAITTFFL